MKNIILSLLLLGIVFPIYSQKIQYSDLMKAVFKGDEFIETLVNGDFILTSHEPYDEFNDGAFLTSLAYRTGYNPETESAAIFVQLLGKDMYQTNAIHLVIIESQKHFFENLSQSITSNSEKLDFRFEEKPIYGNKGRFITTYVIRHKRFLSDGVQFELWKEFNSDNNLVYCIEVKNYLIRR